jgi:hypothetical protein
MKKFYKLFAVTAFMALTASCTTESVQDESAQEVETFTNPSTLRTARAIYPEFDALFRTLYGTSYDINNASIRVSSGGVDFLITEVYESTRHARIIGYFEESQGNVLYYKLDTASRTFTEYDYVTGTYLSHVQDISRDPIFNTGGVDLTVRPNGHPAFGWGASYLGEDCVNGRRFFYENKYFAGIRVNTRPVMQLNGVDQLWAPCE